tara:strand:- start:387 stop:788 length:402 start_codon:yes stop_codon:yes gene_type:complete
MKLALAAVLLLTSTPVIADEYQHGYSSSKTCFREEYREEYVPGTIDDPGYVRSWKETVEFPCRRFHTSSETRKSTVTRTYEEYDTNDCSEGTLAGGLLGGGIAAAISRGDGRWWAIPTGIVAGSMIGCDIDGG